MVLAVLWKSYGDVDASDKEYCRSDDPDGVGTSGTGGGDGTE